MCNRPCPCKGHTSVDLWLLALLFRAPLSFHGPQLGQPRKAPCPLLPCGDPSVGHAEQLELPQRREDAGAWWRHLLFGEWIAGASRFLEALLCVVSSGRGFVIDGVVESRERLLIRLQACSMGPSVTVYLPMSNMEGTKMVAKQAGECEREIHSKLPKG